MLWRTQLVLTPAPPPSRHLSNLPQTPCRRGVHESRCQEERQTQWPMDPLHLEEETAGSPAERGGGGGADRRPPCSSSSGKTCQAGCWNWPWKPTSLIPSISSLLEARNGVPPLPLFRGRNSATIYLPVLQLTCLAGGGGAGANPH